MSGAWSCDSCNTNNLAEAKMCRLCQRPPGSSSGTVREVVTTANQTPQQRNQPKPVFVESKHSEPARITLTPPVSPRAKPTSPPARKSGAAGWVLAIGLFVVVLVVIIMLSGFDFSSSPQPRTPSTPTFSSAPADPVEPVAPTQPPCPSAAAVWLPDGGQGASLIAGYTATKHVITVCQDASGQLYYDGQVKGAAPSSDTHISIPAQKTSAGYIAWNKTYVYEINGAELTVTDNGKLKAQWTLTRTDR